MTTRISAGDLFKDGEPLSTPNPTDARTSASSWQYMHDPLQPKKNKIGFHQQGDEDDNES